MLACRFGIKLFYQCCKRKVQQVVLYSSQLSKFQIIIYEFHLNMSGNLISPKPPEVSAPEFGWGIYVPIFPLGFWVFVSGAVAQALQY